MYNSESNMTKNTSSNQFIHNSCKAGHNSDQGHVAGRTSVEVHDRKKFY